MAITHDASKSGTITSSCETVTEAFTCGASAKILVAKLHLLGSTPSSIAVTYNSVSLTEIASSRKGSITVWMGYLVNPSTGSSYNAVATWTANQRAQLCLSSYTEATLIGSYVSNTGASNNLSCTVPSVAGEMVVDAITVNVTSAISVGAGQTRRTTGAYSGFYTGSSEEAGATSTVMSWSWTGTVDSTQIAVPLKIGTTATVVTPPAATAKTLTLLGNMTPATTYTLPLTFRPRDTNLTFEARDD